MWNSITPNSPIDLKTYLAKLVLRSAIDILRAKMRAKSKASEYTVSLDELA